MAITKTIVIKADTSDAVKSFDDLTDSIEKNERELVSLQKIYEKAPASKNQALKKRIDKLSGSIDKQRQSVKNLTKEQTKANVVGKSTLGNVRDNGGAIAVLDSFTGGLATRTRDAAEATKLFNFNLKLTRGALIATGIGAFVVALGLIVAFWDEILEFVNQTNRKLKDQLVLIEKQRDIFDLQLRTNDLLIKSLEAQGKETGKLLKQRDELLQLDQLELLAKIQILRQQRATLSLKAKELDISQRIAANDLARQGIFLELDGTKTEDLEALAEFDKQIGESTLLLGELGAARAALFRVEDEEDVSDDGDGSSLEKREKAVGIGFDAEKSQADFEAREQARQDEIQAELVFNAKISDIKEVAAVTQAETAILWADLEAEEKLAIAGAALGAISQLIDRQSIAGKGIAIAQVGLNTAQGIIKALASSPPPSPLGAIGAGIVGAVGIAQTIAIAKQKIPSATGRGFVGGGAGAGSAPPPAPSFNLVEGTEGSQINESINFQNQEPVEAFVVSTAVTSSQELDRNIVDGSGI